MAVSALPNRPSQSTFFPRPGKRLETKTSDLLDADGDAEARLLPASSPLRGGAVDTRTGGGRDARRMFVFAFTYCAYCAIYLVRKPVSVVKPYLQAELGASTSQLAAVDSAWLVAYAAGQLGLGAMRSAADPSTLLFLAFLGAGITTALCATATSTVSLALLWGANGLCQACANPLLVLHVASMYAADRRASAVGAWQTSQQIGGVAANLFAAYVLGRSGWRAIFALAGCLVAAVAGPLRAVAKDASVVVAETPRAAAAVDKARRPAATDPLALLRMRGVPSVAAAYFIVKMVRYCMMFWLPFFLVKAAGLDAGEAAKLATLLDLGGAAGGVVVGLVADRAAGGAMILACAPFCLATAVGLAVHANFYERGVAANALCMLLVGFCVAAPDGVLGGAVSRNLCEYNEVEDVGRVAPAVAGVVNGCGSLGAILQGFGTAYLVAALGWRGLFFTLASLMTLAFFLLIPAVKLEAAALARRRDDLALDRVDT